MARSIGALALAAAILAAIAPGSVLAHENELPLPPNALPEVDLFTPDQRLNLSIPEGAILAHPPDQVRVDFRVDEFDLQPSSLELWIDGVEYTEQLMFWMGHATLLILTPDQFWAEGVHSIECSILDANGARFNRDILWELIRPSCHPDCPWPIEPTGEPPVVANIMEDWQDFGSTPFYWHQGVDIRTPVGTEVYSVTDGTVVQVVNYKPTHSKRYLYWEVAVQDPSGFVWQYHHVDSTTIAVSMGAAVNAGDLLGNIVA